VHFYSGATRLSGRFSEGFCLRRLQELSCLPEPAREQVLTALSVLISFESWDQMRHCFGHSMEAAHGVWRSAIDRILPLPG
jgi:hypothetical protein